MINNLQCGTTMILDVYTETGIYILFGMYTSRFVRKSPLMHVDGAIKLISISF